MRGLIPITAFLVKINDNFVSNPNLADFDCEFSLRSAVPESFYTLT